MMPEGASSTTTATKSRTPDHKRGEVVKSIQKAIKDTKIRKTDAELAATAEQREGTTEDQQSDASDDPSSERASDRTCPGTRDGGRILCWRKQPGSRGPVPDYATSPTLVGDSRPILEAPASNSDDSLPGAAQAIESIRSRPMVNIRAFSVRPW